MIKIFKKKLVHKHNKLLNQNNRLTSPYEILPQVVVSRCLFETYKCKHQ